MVGSASEVGGAAELLGFVVCKGRESVGREELAMVARGGLRGGEGGSDTNKTRRIGCVVLIVIDHQRVQVYIEARSVEAKP